MRKTLLTALLASAALSAQADMNCPAGSLPVHVEKDAAILLYQSKPSHTTDYFAVCFSGQPMFGCEAKDYCYTDGSKVNFTYFDVLDLFNKGQLSVKKTYTVKGGGLNIKITAPDGSAQFQCTTNDGQPCA